MTATHHRFLRPCRLVVLPVSTRGTNFLREWLSHNLSSIQGSVIAFAEAVQRMVRAAKLRGIDS